MKFPALTAESIAKVARLRELAAEDGKLAPRTREFAWSLISSADYYSCLSPKQYAHVERIVAENEPTAKPVEREKVEIAPLNGVIALFDKARRHLKFPSVVLNIGSDEDGNFYLVRLYLAGDQARVPGSINVVEHDDDKARSDQLWYGRILRSGQFEISPKVQGDENAKSNVEYAVEQLKLFAANPVEVATEHGKLTGRCCFCHLPLKDERSTGAGYGSTCAKNWGLPWGDRPAEIAEPSYKKQYVRAERKRNIKVRA